MKLVAVDTNVFVKAFVDDDWSMVYFLSKILAECCGIVYPEEPGRPLPKELYDHFSQRGSSSFWKWWSDMERAGKLRPKQPIKVPELANLSEYDRALAGAAIAARCPLFAFQERGFREASPELANKGLTVIIHEDNPDWIIELRCNESKPAR